MLLCPACKTIQLNVIFFNKISRKFWSKQYKTAVKENRKNKRIREYTSRFFIHLCTVVCSSEKTLHSNCYWNCLVLWH